MRDKAAGVEDAVLVVALLMDGASDDVDASLSLLSRSPGRSLALERRQERIVVVARVVDDEDEDWRR